MINAFSKLSDSDLKGLITGLKTSRITPPYTELQVSRVITKELSHDVAQELERFEEKKFNPDQIVIALELIQGERHRHQADDFEIELVTSGPEAPGITNRDTSVVVRELFSQANQSVLVVGYAVYQGDHVFAELANRMQENDGLEVQMYLNISRPDRDTTPSEILVSGFSKRFRDKQWPQGCRLPEVYYDPRSVSDDEPVRSSLHAKCIVVDSEQIFVSSANFTEAAQQRNIEVGLKIRSSWLAKQLIRHFKLMNEHGLAIRAF